MKSLANRAVSAAYNKLGKINDLLNGPDPRFVSYRENGKDKKIENLDLNSEHCHSFIGKMKIDGTGTYSDDVITALLKYFFDHTKKGEKVVIELANKVSELLNGEESMEGNMKYNEQKQHILELAKDLNKKRMNDLEIVDIEDNNTRLFDVLKNEGIKGLESSNGPTMNLDLFLDNMKLFKSFPVSESGDLKIVRTGEKTSTFFKILRNNEVIETMHLWAKFDSLDIAKILYYVAQNDKKYLEEIKGLKRGELKKMSGNVDYYGLIEMAIRINALLHGITLQGGIALQKDYDSLLLKHINPNINDFDLLYQFKVFCWAKLKGEKFKGLYFDTEGSEKLISKLNAKKEFASKTKNNLLIALGVATGVGGTILGSDYIKLQKQKKATQETIKEIFENKRLTRSGDYGYGEYKGKEKMERINEYIQKIYDRFVFRYGTYDKNFDEKEIKASIISCLNNQKLLDELGSDGSGYQKVAIEDMIIDEYLLPQNVGKLGINKIPYESLVPHTDEFINTILLEDDFEIKGDSVNEYDPEWGMPLMTSATIEDIGGFTPKNLGGQFSFRKNRFAIAYHGNKKYVVASPGYVDKLDENDNNNIYSTGRARDLAVDFLEQTNPILNLLIDQYMIRYSTREERGRYNAEGPVKATIDNESELLLIKGFLKGGFLEKIGKDFNVANKQDKINRINEFLDKFISENKSKFKNGINPNLIPNGFLEEYEDAIENTIKEADGILDNIGRLPVMDFGKNQTVGHIGKYQASDGKIYKVGFVEIKGKRYLYADEEGSPSYGNMTYGPYEGRIVAIDYMKQAKPIIKNLLDIYRYRYFNGNKPIENSNMMNITRAWDIFDNMLHMMVTDIMSKGLLKKLGSESEEIRNQILISYIDNFVKENLTELKRLKKYDDNKSNPNMIPNYFLLGHENAMRNTIENKDKIYLSNYLSVADKLFGNIGIYYASDGKKYSIWEANINGKSYLCAEADDNKTDDVLSVGKVVAEDYFKTMNKK